MVLPTEGGEVLAHHGLVSQGVSAPALAIGLLADSLLPEAVESV